MAAPRAIESATIPESLSEIGIKPGLQIQIEHTRSRQRLRTELIGSVGEEFLILSAPSARSFAHKGEVLRLRLMSGNWICAFDARLESTISKPFSAWVLAYPDAINVARLRSHTRLPIQIRVRVDGADPLEGPEDLYGLITDIHLQGASLETTIPVGKVGDQIFITTLISFAGSEQLVLLSAKLANQSRHTLSRINTYQYGLSFDPLDEETRIFLQGFLAQQQLELQGYTLK